MGKRANIEAAMETVAVLHLPMRVKGFAAMQRALREAYGPGLVFQSDSLVRGRMNVERPATATKEEGEN